MIVDYEISLGTPNDIPGILTLQELNLVERGGGLSVRQTADWFRHAIFEKSLVVGRRDGKVVGYVLGTSLAAKAHVTMVQAMLRAFPAPPDCYLYGPVCVAEAERGKGLAGALFKELQALGIRHRDRLNAERNIGFSATVSTRALNVAGVSLAFFFHHDGTSPQRIGTSSRFASRSITASIVVVGQIL